MHKSYENINDKKVVLEAAGNVMVPKANGLVKLFRYVTELFKDEQSVNENKKIEPNKTNKTYGSFK